MANLLLPVDESLPAFSYNITLDGTIFTLRYTFNERMGKWFIDLSTENGRPIISGIPIVTDWPLFQRFADSRKPAGEIFAFDTSRQIVDPGRFDLGSRVLMIYQEAGTNV